MASPARSSGPPRRQAQGASRRPRRAAARRAAPARGRGRGASQPSTRARYRRDRLYLAGIAVLVLVLGLMALGPYADLTAAQQRVATLEAQQAGLDEAVLALEDEAERLQDPAALEEQAREDLGMARPGEIPYIVVNPEEEDPSPVNAAAPPPSEPAPSVVDRIIGWARSWGR